MAPAKNLWNREMYAALLSASSKLMAAFVLLGLSSILLLVGNDVLAAWLALAAAVSGAMGVVGMKSVFIDLVEASGPAPAEARTASLAAAEPVATREAAVPSAWESFADNAPVTKAPVKRARPAESWTTKVDWEEWVGKKLLQKAGMLIVLIGMLVFLKYSFDNGWVDELGRVFLSAVAAAALLVAGEFFHGRYGKWSQAFTGGGLALLYLTVWVAHVLYAQQLAVKYGIVVPEGVAFILYSIITLIGALASVRYKAQTIAWFTVLGGYLTPFLVHFSNTNHTSLLLYLAVLAGGLILLSWRQKWRHLQAAAFGFTQFYLFTSIYTSVPEFGDVEQVITAVGFFLLFSIIPLLYQFRLDQKADGEDIALLVLNGAAVFLPIVDALGGWSSGYVGFVCLGLAAFYLVFTVASLQRRSDDELLVNTYLVGTILLIAGALLAEMETDWVAMGWAPYSTLIAWASISLKRRGPWICAVGLMVGSLFFLLINMPVLTAGAETIWHPLTSNWAIQSYAVFASIAAWIALSNRLPENLLSKESRPQMQTLLHGAFAVVLFLAVTFESTRLVFDIDLVWTFAYIAFAVAAIVIFFITESMAWFVAAVVTQILALLFIFLLGDNSGMGVMTENPLQPLLHPWSYLSVMALLATVAMVYVAQLKQHKVAGGISVQRMLIGLALAQIWVHVSVEITNFKEAYDWTDLTASRVLSTWWTIYALAVIGYGMLRNNVFLRKVGIGLLIIPFAYIHVAILGGEDRMIETMVWTALSLGTAIAGARMKYDDMLKAGMILLCLTAGIDMFAHLGDSGAGFIRSSWWALAGLVTMIAGFMERSKPLRQLAMVIFGATVLKLLVFDFSGLETPVRIAASIATGLLLIGASYLYQRFDSALVSVKK